MPKSTKGKLGCALVVIVMLVVCVVGVVWGPLGGADIDIPEISMAAEQIKLPFRFGFFDTEIPDPGYHADESLAENQHAEDAHAEEQQVEEQHTIKVSTIPNTLPPAILAVIVLIIIAAFAFRKPKLVPSGLQNGIEAVVEMLLNFIESIAGEANGRRFLPMVGTFFFYILLSNLMGLLPGFGSIMVPGVHKGHLTRVPLFRSANADLNTTIALALVTVVATQVYGLSTLKLNYLTKFFNFGKLREFFSQVVGRRPRPSGMDMIINLFLGIGYAFVGILELISEFIKIVSFSFRLFGNIFAGEVLLIVIGFLAAFIAPLVFMGLEVFVGFVQALIFAMLSLVFFSTAVEHHGDEEAH